MLPANNEPDDSVRPTWTFLTIRAGVTDRAAQAMISNLVREGYVTRMRSGQRNRHQINPSASQSRAPRVGQALPIPRSQARADNAREACGKTAERQLRVMWGDVRRTGDAG